MDIRNLLKTNILNIFPNDEPFLVLVLDALAADSIAPVLSLGELRQVGITLLLSLHTYREKISDVPAVYICAPTLENVNRILQDTSSGLYRSVFLTFTQSVPEHILAHLAKESLRLGTASRFEAINERYLNFISLEPHLFILNSPSSPSLSSSPSSSPSSSSSSSPAQLPYTPSSTYYELNRTDATQETAQALLHHLADGLLSALLNLSATPIIRCAQGSTSHMLAGILEKELRKRALDIVPDAPMFIGQEVRPLLLIVDRSIDLSMELVVEEDHPSGSVIKTKKKFSLDSAQDTFWAENMGQPFPAVMKKAAELENEYRASKERLARMGSGTSEELISQDRVADQTKELSSVVSSLPEFQKKKLLIDTHINTATAMVAQINQRKLDQYIQLEESILSRSSSADPDALLAWIRDPEKGAALDKLRLFLIYYYETDALTKDMVDAFEHALAEAGAPDALQGLVNHVRILKTFAKKRPSSALPKPSPQVAAPGSLLARGYDQLAGYITAGVQLINAGNNKDCHLARLVDAALHAPDDEASQFGSFVNIDPKTPAGHPAAIFPGQFRSVIVFVVGGGSYVEYQHLQALAQRQAHPTTIVYGSSDMYSPSMFLDQISMIARPPSLNPSSSTTSSSR